MKSPFSPNTHALEFWDGNVLRSYLYFGAMYSARKFLDAVIGDARVKEVNKDRIMIPRLDGMNIYCTELKQIMAYKYEPDEKKWQLPAPYDGFAIRLRGGEKVSTPRNDDTRQYFEPTRSSRNPARQRASSDDAPKRDAGDKGKHTLASIVLELNVKDLDMRRARAIMRRHKIEKPYAWDDPESIIKLLKGKS